MPLISVDYHEGGCCGVRHLSCFSGNDDRYQDRLHEVKRAIKGQPNHPMNGHHKSGKYMEIILTDHQIETSPNLVAGLKKLGFKLKSRFNNSSGSWCNVIVYCHAPSRLKDSPWHKDSK